MSAPQFLAGTAAPFFLTRRSHSESPKTERNATEEPQHVSTRATPLHLSAQVGDPRVELRLVMGAATHAIADPRRQRLSAGDALSGPIVGRSFIAELHCELPEQIHDRFAH